MSTWDKASRSKFDSKKITWLNQTAQRVRAPYLSDYATDYGDIIVISPHPGHILHQINNIHVGVSYITYPALFFYVVMNLVIHSFSSLLLFTLSHRGLKPIQHRVGRRKNITFETSPLSLWATKYVYCKSKEPAHQQRISNYSTSESHWHNFIKLNSNTYNNILFRSSTCVLIQQWSVLIQNCKVNIRKACPFYFKCTDLQSFAS